VFYHAKRLLFLGMINIWRHKLRSTLTILGIVFGVCSVIAMLAIGEGSKYEALEEIKKLGSQNIILKSVKPPKSEAVNTETTQMVDYGLKYKDAKTIRETVPSVEVIVPSRTIRTNITYGKKRLDGNVIGVVPWYSEVSNQRLKRGRFLTEREMTDSKNVCVLSADLAGRLFTTESPLNKVVKVKSDYYTVIGVMEGSGMPSTESTEGSSEMNLFIPLTAAKSRFGNVLFTRSSGSFTFEKVELHQIIVKVNSVDSVLKTSEAIRNILKRFHKKADYEVVVPLKLLEQAQKTERIFNIVLGSIAAISLLVGGIGIMNIMLASVTERTREIGIRRALGAKKRDIVTQFLTETVMLSGSGGVVGLLLGFVIPFLVTHFAGMITIVRLYSIVGAFSISLAIGVVFGIYPAYRAAQMDPIAALRHE